MISADRGGDDVREGVESVAPVGEQDDSAAGFSRGHHEGLKSQVISAVNEEQIVAVFFEADSKSPGKRVGVFYRHGIPRLQLLRGRFCR
jgi:hypothetical protein